MGMASTGRNRESAVEGEMAEMSVARAVGLVKEKRERNEKYDGCKMGAPAPSQSSRHDMTTATKVELES
jgi:hypothetical protein